MERNSIGGEGFKSKVSLILQNFPHTLINMEADEGTGVTLEVSAEIDGAWSIIKTEEKCELIPTSPSNPKAKVAMSLIPHGS
ncbi:hypothetical protein [Algoriphagus boritolerans]|uniref:hypothetical protein n=1 Tax=Algoriphagus boritolerans TaxID=308111 RepID=UPI002FCE429E